MDRSIDLYLVNARHQEMQRQASRERLAIARGPQSQPRSRAIRAAATRFVAPSLPIASER